MTPKSNTPFLASAIKPTGGELRSPPLANDRTHFTLDADPHSHKQAHGDTETAYRVHTRRSHKAHKDTLRGSQAHSVGSHSLTHASLACLSLDLFAHGCPLHARFRVALTAYVVRIQTQGLCTRASLRLIQNLHTACYIVRYHVVRLLGLHSDDGHARMLLLALGNATMAHAVTMSLGIRDTIPRITAVGQAHACVYGYSLQGRPGLGVCTLLFYS